jgi:hypothetical protein
VLVLGMTADWDERLVLGMNTGCCCMMLRQHVVHMTPADPSSSLYRLRSLWQEHRRVAKGPGGAMSGVPESAGSPQQAATE